MKYWKIIISTEKISVSDEVFSQIKEMLNSGADWIDIDGLAFFRADSFKGAVRDFEREEDEQEYRKITNPQSQLKEPSEELKEKVNEERKKGVDKIRERIREKFSVE